MRNYWIRKSWDLKIEVKEPPPDYFFGREFIISKGPYSVNFFGDGATDLRDAFGMDASIEMANMLIQDLEHHKLSETQKLHRLSFGSIFGSKRIALIAKEKVRILRLVRALRSGEDFSEYLT